MTPCVEIKTTEINSEMKRIGETRGKNKKHAGMEAGEYQMNE